ncbi:MAG: XkdX family protein [Clostridia bacterium]|nr:XkdX family protein [Clostridia bacterium]
MEHSAKFEKVKGYYDSGLWNETRVRNAVIKGWITEEEYEEITGNAYAE